jgi:hypothetical protein
MNERRPGPTRSPRRPLLARALDRIERTGNRLPDPVTIFVLLAAGVLVASWICARLGVSAIHPRDGSVITAVNLLDRDGLRRIFTEAVRNFTSFAPLGIVLVAMIGVGVAEKTGLITLSLRSFVGSMPPRLLTASVIFAGMLAHLAADAGVIILPPIAAMLFAAAGRNPLVGLAAAASCRRARARDARLSTRGAHPARLGAGRGREAPGGDTRGLRTGLVACAATADTGPVHWLRRLGPRAPGAVECRCQGAVENDCPPSLLDRGAPLPGDRFAGDMGGAQGPGARGSRRAA